ncbi:MAG: methyltransferase [Pseudonocardiaceae bacterium]
MTTYPEEIERTIGTPPSLVQLLELPWKPRAIHVAARLHLAETLADGPRTVAELAEASGTHAPSLYRLLRALACIGIFAQLDEGRFANNELSSLLHPDVPGSLYVLAMTATDWSWHAWGELLHSVQTGKPGFDKVYSMSMWQYLTECDPESGALFNKALTDFSVAGDASVAQAADLAGVHTVVDVGGGHGGLLMTLLATHSSIEQGILFDQPHVIDEARSALSPARDGRLQLDGGDFFTAVPAGADLYVMKQILHNWDDAACIQLLTTCQHAMPNHSRVLAVELVIDPDRIDEHACNLDLQMLVYFASRERTAAEFRALYDAAGLHLTRIMPTTSALCLIEGIPQGNG